MTKHFLLPPEDRKQENAYSETDIWTNQKPMSVSQFY
jgi:hypothetical protein